MGAQSRHHDTYESGNGRALWVAHGGSIGLLENCAAHLEVVLSKTEIYYEANVFGSDKAFITARCQARSYGAAFKGSETRSVWLVGVLLEKRCRSQDRVARMVACGSSVYMFFTRSDMELSVRIEGLETIDLLNLV